jgi:hypothetical protein
MTPRTEPPALASWLLRRCLPPQLSESAIGDLEEERAVHGAGRCWFWRHALALALALGYRWHRGPRPEWPREARRSRGEGPMESLLRNARYGARVLARTPAFTVVAVLTLALGIGANAAIFSVVSALLIRPLPLPNADRLVTGVDKDRRSQYLSLPDFEDPWGGRSGSSGASRRSWPKS